MLKKALVGIFSLLYATTSIAQWYESQAKAVIINGDQASARVVAMENALKKALLVAGASVSSVQQVVNGLITQDELSIRASGTVNSIEVIQETFEGDAVSVTIRADIFPQEQQCFAADFKKTLLVTRANLINREQANIGQIYDLDTQVVSNFADKLKKKSQYINIKLANKNKIPFSRYNQSFETEKIKDLSIELGHMFNSQFILYTEINDVSFDNQELNSWQFWQEDKYRRHFNTTFYVYSAINGEHLATQSYENLAPWQFAKRDEVDTDSQVFWQSSYGQMIDRTLENAIIDIDESMMCEQTRAKILKVTGNEIMVNVGKQQGVKLGDEFSLLHLNNYRSDQGRLYSGYNISPYHVKITQVYQDTAIASSTKEELLGNIQVNDLAVKVDKF